MSEKVNIAVLIDSFRYSKSYSSYSKDVFKYLIFEQGNRLVKIYEIENNLSILFGLLMMGYKNDSARIFDYIEINYFNGRERNRDYYLFRNVRYKDFVFLKELKLNIVSTTRLHKFSYGIVDINKVFKSIEKILQGSLYDNDAMKYAKLFKYVIDNTTDEKIISKVNKLLNQIVVKEVI